MKGETMRNNKGFTVIELMFVMVITMILLGYGVIYSAILAGNFWFTEDGVLRKIQIQDETAVSVIDSNRNVFWDSGVTVIDKDGDKTDWKVDANILFDYEVKPDK